MNIVIETKKAVLRPLFEIKHYELFDVIFSFSSSYGFFEKCH